MGYKIELTDTFKKQAKRLTKKYISLKKEIKELSISLAENPTIGICLADNIYKIRLAVASKNKGKSGGARVITLVKVVNESVYLMTIYNKGDKDTISEAEITALLNEI